MLHRPVCVKCEVELRPKKNGVGCLDYAYWGEEKKEERCQIWDADLWECPKCGYQIVEGFGVNPIDIHSNQSFPVTIENYRKQSILIHNRTR
ncbi:MAG: hypothetical protein MUP81_06370 [Dehalococcoidia bacterium]|nr:hypothetical protein [Dehalococcoidia bacterium]